MFFLKKVSRFYINPLIGTLLLVSIGIAEEFFVEVNNVNTTTVAKYEKFEAILTLSGASYDNPFDPDQIDIRAFFKSPSDSVWQIFCFYDNYNSRNQWKVRFAPNETGEWEYYLTAVNGDSSYQSSTYNFTAATSSHKGWMRVSGTNPHYFEYDNGESYYPVGPYYSWGITNDENGLGLLEENDVDFFGYWNIMYDQGEIIESINSGLGKYDQPKCGRIDNIIQWAEQRGMKVMLAIWPHDLLSNTVWAHQWHQNPYNTLCDVNDFYADATAWEYQEKQYRYLIARYGYSRALGVWEIVNEINGTDGWQNGYTAEATNWVGKVNDYLAENDPFNRPITANQSGGIYWPEGYSLVDIPNVHLYETSWTADYPGNPLRSSYHVYRKVARQFWADFEKPGIYGEAGYTNTFGNFDVPSSEYTEHFHNAQWASWASGLAATPLWWSFYDRNMMSPELTAHYKYFSAIIGNYDYAHKQLADLPAGLEDVDVFAMTSGTDGFGWLREIWGNPVSGKLVRFTGLADTSYYLHWFNTWTGNKITTTINVSVAGVMEVIIPLIDGNHPDVAFFFELAEEGEEATLLEIYPYEAEILNLPGSRIDISCYIKDDEGRIVSTGDHPVTFNLNGTGKLVGENPVIPDKAIARIQYEADDNVGDAVITVTSPGLASDSILVTITNKILMDDFESYDANSELQYFWKPRSGTSAMARLHGGYVGSGYYSMDFSYGIGEPYPPYAGLFTHIFDDLTGANKLNFWIKPDGSNRNLVIVLHEIEGSRYWQYDWQMSTDDARKMEIHLSEFFASDGAGNFDPEAIGEISFNIFRGNGENGNGNIYFDDIYFSLPSQIVSISGEHNASLPGQFSLEQNYPNPFNPTTSIRFNLPKTTPVEIKVFNSNGQFVEQLINKTLAAGFHEVEWHPLKMASGIYFYRIEAGKYSEVKKCILLK